MNWQNFIEINPAVLTGKPVIKGTRLAVDFIVGLMASGWTEQQILTNYPNLTRDHLLACLSYARDTLSNEKTYSISG